MSELNNSKIFTKESLLEHVGANSDRTYLAIHDNVYDVTEFLDEVIKKNFLFQILKY